MCRVMLGLLLLGAAPALGSAQSYGEHHGQGYAYFAPGASSPGGSGTIQMGGGGEGLVYKGVGLGGELGYLVPWQSFTHGLGVVSFDGSYHFNRSQKLVPFVSCGYTLFFRSGAVNGINFGGGVNYWFRERVGLRLEFRDQVGIELEGPSSHFYGLRVGLSFR